MQINQEEKEFLKKYGKHLSELKNQDSESCPASERLYSYFNKELAEREAEAVEDHTNMCPMCLAAYERLLAAEESSVEKTVLPENWEKIEEALDKKFYTSLETVSPPSRKKVEYAAKKNISKLLREKWQELIKTVFKPKRLIWVGGLVVIVIAFLYTYAFLSRPSYFNMARIEPDKVGVLRRADPTSTIFTAGLNAFEEKNYGKAIALFDTFRKTHHHHYHTNYYLGLSYLFEARVRLPGFPYSFDTKDTEKGITYLKKALQLADENQFYQEDCYWYLGKAYVMLGEFEVAKGLFNNILRLSQPNLMRKGETGEMVLRIDRELGR